MGNRQHPYCRLARWATCLPLVWWHLRIAVRSLRSPLVSHVLEALRTALTSTMLSYLPYNPRWFSRPAVYFFSPCLLFFWEGTSQGLLTLHFAFSQGLCCLGQVAVMNVHTGMIIASLYTFLTVIYPRDKQYWVRLCNIQLGNKPKQKSQEKKHPSIVFWYIHPSWKSLLKPE